MSFSCRFIVFFLVFVSCSRVNGSAYDFPEVPAAYVEGWAAQRESGKYVSWQSEKYYMGLDGPLVKLFSDDFENIIAKITPPFESMAAFYEFERRAKIHFAPKPTEPISTEVKLEKVDSGSTSSTVPISDMKRAPKPSRKRSNLNPLRPRNFNPKLFYVSNCDCKITPTFSGKYRACQKVISHFQLEHPHLLKRSDEDYNELVRREGEVPVDVFECRLCKMTTHRSDTLRRHWKSCHPLSYSKMKSDFNSLVKNAGVVVKTEDQDQVEDDVSVQDEEEQVEENVADEDEEGAGSCSDTENLTTSSSSPSEFFY